jgi:type IV fimbrial biogenesis protein FimT
MNFRAQHGFTLWELLITLLVAGILLGIGVPNVMEFQRNGAMTAAANQLVTGVLLARTESVKQQAPVGLCLTANPTDAIPVCAPNAVADAANLGFVVWVDENNNVDANGARILTDPTDGNGVIDAGELVLMRQVAPGGTIRVSANCGYVSYGRNGFTRQVAGLCNPNPRAVLFCDDRGRRVAAGQLSSARVVTIDGIGRGQVYQEATNVANVGVNWFITNTLAGVNPTCP